MGSLLSLLLLALGGSPDGGPFVLVLGARLPVLSDPNDAGTVDVDVVDISTIV